jgi:hypothetical protein
MNTNMVWPLVVPTGQADAGISAASLGKSSGRSNRRAISGAK